MARGDLVQKLIVSYGRGAEFRSAALEIIAEAEAKKQVVLAKQLRRSLEFNLPDLPANKSLAKLSGAKDPALELLDVREPERAAADIVLDRDTRRLIEAIVEEHRRGEELRRHGLVPRSKLLFSGPPGCGKTLSAEILARELGLPLCVARLDSLVVSFLGETASNLRRIFDYAKANACVLFLDEFDALARARVDVSVHGELRRVVNSLLLLIDRFESRGLLIAATNLETTLDGAIWRRFDEIVYFDLPGRGEIERMLALKFKNFPVNFDLKVHAEKLGGYSYAEIERVCLDAIKRTVLKRHKTVSETEFMAAMRDEQRRKTTSEKVNSARRS